MLRWTSIIAVFMCWALVTKANVPTQCEVVTLAFPEAVWMMPNTARVPFQLVGRLIVVEAQIDTVRGSFVLDTGAEQLVLNARHFRPDYISGATAAAGVTGSVETVGRKKVSALELDVFRLKRLRADVIDLSHIEKKKNHRILGLLGFSVLENFELFVDFKLKQLIFTKVGSLPNRVG